MDRKKIQKKIKNLGRVISQIGYDVAQHPPVIIGPAEVENKYVLEELISSKFLRSKGYQYIHFNSPDERDIDTALLFRESHFTVLQKEAHPLYIENQDGRRDYTRDILQIKGEIENNVVYILANHWPSRRAGAEDTSYKRIAAANKNQEIITTITSKDPNTKIIVMEDFNDDPKSESVKSLSKISMYNPIELLLTNYSGSLNYRGKWNFLIKLLSLIIFYNNTVIYFGLKKQKSLILNI